MTNKKKYEIIKQSAKINLRGRYMDYGDARCELAFDEIFGKGYLDWIKKIQITLAAEQIPVNIYIQKGEFYVEE